MSNAILPQALVLLVAGMSIVYIFLYLLVVVMRGAAMIVPRFNHLMPDDAPRPAARPVPLPTADDAAIAVAIAASASADHDRR